MDDSSKGSLYNNDQKKIQGFKLNPDDISGMLEEKVLTEYGDIFETKRCIIKGNTRPVDFLQKYKSNFFTDKVFVLSGKIHNLQLDEQESTFIEFPIK